jgi:hypothetical protein
MAVPSRLRPLYEAAPDGTPEGYVLTAPGRVLASYRAKRAADPVGEIRTPVTALSRPEWITLVGAADPGAEREWLLKSAAAKRIKVEG